MISDTLAYAARAIAIKPKLAELRKATDALQTNFVESLLKEMRKGLDEDSDMAGSDVYNGMVNDVLAQQISKKSNLGISDMIFGQLSKLAINEIHPGGSTASSTSASDSAASPAEQTVSGTHNQS